MISRSAAGTLSTTVDVVLTHEIPMDALTALVTERRDRFTDEAESFRLARTAARALRAARAARRTRSGTRVTVAPGACGAVDARTCT